MRPQWFGYTVYQWPSDFPRFLYAVRPWLIEEGLIVMGAWAALSNEYHEIVAPMVDHGLVRLPRQPVDDPAIMEVWL